MLNALLAGFFVAALAPWIARRIGFAAGWTLAIFPAGLALYVASFIPQIAAGRVVGETVPWVPHLGVDFAWRLDGLGVLMLLLIYGIGALVVVYAGAYLKGSPRLGRLYAALLAFMSAMAGIAVADNLLLLFVFWEITSVTSYMLIGTNHEREEARAAALQALLVTGGGGLALLAGIILLGGAAGTYEVSQMLARADAIRAHALYAPATVLVLVGAFAKSAQVPLHFWLPGAMEAPTPVSAYLHSATMVKAGVFLLARMTPVLGGTDLWNGALMLFGAATFLTGSLMALRETDLKRILAYSTVGSLGAMTLLLGVGTAGAVKAAIVFLLAHGLYKGALFLVAGILDHETGTRDATHLSGLRRAMPITATAGVLAAASTAGLPPFGGFLAKEVVYEALLAMPNASVAWMAVALLANAASGAVAFIAGIRPFVGGQAAPPGRAGKHGGRAQVAGKAHHGGHEKTPHDPPISLWVGALMLAALGVIIGGAAPWVGDQLVGPAAAAVLGKSSPVSLKLWHGINAALLWSIVTILASAALYVAWGAIRRASAPLDRLAPLGPASLFRASLAGMTSLAAAQTRLLQTGRLRSYVGVLLLAVIAAAAATLGARGTAAAAVAALAASSPSNGALAAVLRDLQPLDVAVVVTILAGAIAAATATSRLAAITALGVVGYGIATVYLLFGAPDLAITQFAIETLTVVLFVLVLYRLPRFRGYSPTSTRLRDAVIAGAAGLAMAAFVLVALAQPHASRIAPYFATASVPQAQGRNVVNVILVDFRGLDTLGEITVLVCAAFGVYALMRLRPRDAKSRGAGRR